MKICPKCGSSTSDDTDEFCTRCGAYYSKDAGASKTSAVGAALGMSSPRREQAIPGPDDGTLESGIDDLRAGNFPEAIAQFTSHVRRAGQPSADEYDLMISEISSCIASAAESGKNLSFAGLSDLAMELDEDILADMMRAVSQIPSVPSSPVALVLAFSQMNLLLTGFDVFPDLRDLSEMFTSARSNVGAIISSDPESADAIAPIMSFMELMQTFMSKAIEEAGDERMDELADYWSSKANLPYSNIAFQIAAMQIQMSMANAGRLASKLFKKGLDIQLDAFKRSYFSPRLRSQEVRELALLDLIAVEHRVHRHFEDLHTFLRIVVETVFLAYPFGYGQIFLDGCFVNGKGQCIAAF